MRALSFRPSLTMRGRTFKGLRGWAGKPLHPPLTDVPVGAYTLVAAFDVISFVGGDQEWTRDFYRAGTFTLIGGALVSLLAALTGFWGWLKSTQKGTPVAPSTPTSGRWSPSPSWSSATSPCAGSLSERERIEQWRQRRSQGRYLSSLRPSES